jgi:hypothetical protein
MACEGGREEVAPETRRSITTTAARALRMLRIREAGYNLRNRSFTVRKLVTVAPSK